MTEYKDSFSDTFKTIFSCEGHTRLHSRSLDQDLGPFEKVAYWLHYVRCLFCRRHDKQLTAIDKAAHCVHSAEPEMQMPSEAKLSISEKLKQEIESE